jgi:urocanate hydratase
VLRHVDAGYSKAIEFAKAHDLNIPTEARPQD